MARYTITTTDMLMIKRKDKLNKKRNYAWCILMHNIYSAKSCLALCNILNSLQENLRKN